MQKNNELKEAQDRLENFNEELEERVKERTAELTVEIAERKAMEAEVRKSEERFRGIFENSPLGIALVDEHHVPFQVNRSLCTMLGYSADELITQTFPDLTHSDDNSREAALSRAVLDGVNDSYSLEKRFVKRSGESLPVQLTATILKEKDGQLLGFIEIIEDLTKRKEAEAATLLARDQAIRVERLERELSSLASLSSTPGNTVTAKMYGAVNLQEGFPESFQNLVNVYGELLDLALEQQIYKVDHDISGRLLNLAETLGFYKSGPRDVVDIHTAALKEKSRSAGTSEKRKAYTGEGWIMVLELMGHLVSYYRNHATVHFPHKR